MDLAFNPWLAFGWAMLAGFVISMGAGGGGILAGIGHISILGLGDANLIKASNLVLEFAGRIVSAPLYHRQNRLVWPLAAMFGAGATFGAVAGAWVSKHHLGDMAVYRPVFGLVVMLVAARVLYEAWSPPSPRHRRAVDQGSGTSRVPSDIGDGLPASRPVQDPPRTVSFTIRKARIEYAGRELEFDPRSVAGGAFAIAFLSGLAGVGGGFLVMPFMAGVLLFPMYLVAGTGLVALMIPLAAGVVSYMAMQVNMDWRLLAVEVPGVMLGSVLGPSLNRFMSERLLRLYTSVVLFGFGGYYLF